jgi:hypothetical protein
MELQGMYSLRLLPCLLQAKANHRQESNYKCCQLQLALACAVAKQLSQQLRQAAEPSNCGSGTSAGCQAAQRV